MPTYGSDGLTRCVVADLDAERGDVDRDAQLIEIRVRAAGGYLIADHSPGGRHLYLLLREGVPADEVLQVLQGWQADCPSLDPAPMRSAHAGLIAPPGALHKSGRGHRQLTTSWPDAQALIDQPNAPTVWQQLLATAPKRRLSSQTAGPSQQTPLREAVDPITHGMGAAYVAIAQTGDTSAYPSPSEARQAVLWSAAAAGLSLTDVARRIHTGAWPGLAGLYSRYSPHHRHNALARDWRKATALVEKHRADRARNRPDRQCNTRGQETHPPAPTGHRGVRDWDNVLAHVERHQLSADPTKILILRAMGQAAQRRGEPQIIDGVRALSLATHLNIATISRGLSELRDAEEPLVTRTAEAHGFEADTYQLVIPDTLRHLTRQRWRRGRLRALHPAFRALGRVAGFCYEALARADTGLGVLDLLERVPYASKSALDDALATLAAHGLATAHRAGRRTLWSVGPESADGVAEQLGADTVHRALVRRYALERALFHAVLLDWWATRGAWWTREPPDEPDPPPPI
ncbi:hypothetical protein CGZ93_10440 [Enemella dayhoffiae]|uniref:Uncharacterized protein n=1 Tax=Enemella dayhoffiae TaxID=2016507 RepID=A0A255H1F8_9ACTN|nr:hypothetical protein CGZ93_10440 [Enemella dayhoffiae]